MPRSLKVRLETSEMEASRLRLFCFNPQDTCLRVAVGVLYALQRMFSDLVGEGSDDDLYTEEEREILLPERIRKRSSRDPLNKVGLLAY